MSRDALMLGDIVSKALEKVGVTPERISEFLGRPCRCKERRAKLNSLSAWAVRVVSGKTDNMRGHLGGIMGDDQSEESP